MSAPDDGDEFALIRAHFAPLARHPGARGLTDDAALWRFEGDVVITCDAIVEGVHFLPDDPIDTVARKAVRVNLSDLAGKGARADGVLVCLAWPRSRKTVQIAAFAEGLAADIAAFGFALLGGDMTATDGPLTVAVTAFGGLSGPRAPARSAASAGEDLWVSGTIGDAFLGLAARRGGLAALALEDRAFLAERYQLPQPRLALSAAIATFAGASMDLSDGLITDARKLAAASGVALRIEAGAVPLSPAAQNALAAGLATPGQLMAGGDDYEVLFTAAPAHRAALAHAGAACGVRLTRIGAVEPGAGVSARDAAGLDHAGEGAGGYVHRLGADV